MNQNVFLFSIALCVLSIDSFGQKELRITLSEKVYSRMLNATAIEELTGTNEASWVKNMTPKLLGGSVNGEHGFMLTFEDANRNGRYDDIGEDLICISMAGRDSVYLHASVSCCEIKPITTVMIHNKVFRFKYINTTKNYVLLRECDSCSKAVGFSPTIKLVDSMPNLDVELVGGGQMNLRNLIGQKRFIYVDFWGSWCPPCIVEIPELQKIVNEYGDDLLILSMNYKDTKEDVERFIKSNNMNWLNGFSNKTINSEFMVAKFPYGILFNDNGELIDSNITLSQLKSYLASHRKD